jgi:hypothetical protein
MAADIDARRGGDSPSHAFAVEQNPKPTMSMPHFGDWLVGRAIAANLVADSPDCPD